MLSYDKKILKVSADVEDVLDHDIIVPPLSVRKYAEGYVIPRGTSLSAIIKKEFEPSMMVYPKVHEDCLPPRYDRVMGSVSPSKPIETQYKKTVQIKAIPTDDVRYVFENWELPDGTLVTDNPINYEVLEESIVTAIFNARQFYVTTTMICNDGATGHNDVTRARPKGGQDSTVQFWSFYDEGTILDYVTIDGVKHDWGKYGIENAFVYKFENVGANHLVEATFKRTPKVVVAGISGDSTKGTVSGSGTYYEGMPVTLTATPLPGYRFSRWQEDGVTTATRTFTAKESVSYTAIFTDDTMSTLIAESTNATRGTATGSGEYALNSYATVTATANDGYKVEKIVAVNDGGHEYTPSRTSPTTFSANISIGDRLSNVVKCYFALRDDTCIHMRNCSDETGTTRVGIKVPGGGEYVKILSPEGESATPSLTRVDLDMETEYMLTIINPTAGKKYVVEASAPEIGKPTPPAPTRVSDYEFVFTTSSDNIFKTFYIHELDA